MLKQLSFHFAAGSLKKEVVWGTASACHDASKKTHLNAYVRHKLLPPIQKAAHANWFTIPALTHSSSGSSHDWGNNPQKVHNRRRGLGVLLHVYAVYVQTLFSCQTFESLR